MEIVNDREKIDVVIDKIYNMQSNATSGGQTTNRARFANQVCTGAAIAACTKLLEGNGK